MSTANNSAVRHLNDQPELSSEGASTGATKCTISDTLRTVDMGHSDVSLQVNNTVFQTHKHILCKFAQFEIMLQNTGPTGSDPSIILHRDECGVEDITNTFKILYATVIDGPFHFEPTILVSALRISTDYDFPNLRDYAIRELGKASLGAIQRIQIAREFGLASWEAPAYSELSRREAALTQEEAQILGFSAFTTIVQAREEEILKRGMVLGKQELKEEIRLGHEKIKKKREEERIKKLAQLRAKLKA
ncbi:unnamed protein product [Rhizoctonia solani]|uniref:BTB domain-containing protein n=1 Tax=Rhizoctonia solani TaxID=456999 RepID=A0A8H2WM77_9AGAM|nr:unnamed protein product [Rhizoctonia solani]